MTGKAKRKSGKKLSKMQIKEVLRILEDVYGGSKTALNYKTPFQLLVATILAAQSTDKRVNIVTPKLFNDYPDAKSMSHLSESELQAYIKTVGLYKSKAKNIIRTSQLLAENYDGDIPDTREALVQLPGVGRKTANVVLSIAKNVPAIAVDTHVFRVSNRIGLANAETVLETEKQLMQNIPKKKWAEAHHWLIWHGRNICKARRPLCEKCPVAHLCLYYKKIAGNSAQ